MFHYKYFFAQGPSPAILAFSNLLCLYFTEWALCRIIEHCIKKRLMWNTCFARKVCKEAEYYEDMLRYLRRNLAVCIAWKLFLIPCTMKLLI